MIVNEKLKLHIKAIYRVRKYFAGKVRLLLVSRLDLENTATILREGKETKATYN